MDQELPDLLRQIGVWEEVNNATVKYLQNIDKGGPEFAVASLVPTFKYNYSDLAAISKQLLDCIIMEPFYYEHVLRTVILEAVNLKLKSLSCLLQVKFEQIHCVQNLTGLPVIEDYQFYPKIAKTLSNFACVVTGRSDVKMRIRHTVWYCEFKCPFNVITGDIRLDANVKIPKCHECQAGMKEYVKLRDMPEYVMLSALPLQSVQTPRSIGKVYEKFMVRLSDELAQFNVVMGNAYTVTGLYDGSQKMFLAWNIAEMKDV